MERCRHARRPFSADSTADTPCPCERAASPTVKCFSRCLFSLRFKRLSRRGVCLTVPGRITSGGILHALKLVRGENGQKHRILGIGVVSSGWCRGGGCVALRRAQLGLNKSPRAAGRDFSTEVQSTNRVGRTRPAKVKLPWASSSRASICLPPLTIVGSLDSMKVLVPPAVILPG